MYEAIIDANINRMAEGLRVIEEYVRFIRSHEAFTQELTALRHSISHEFPHHSALLLCRDTADDMRSQDMPRKRGSLQDVLVANFKRAQQACRVLEEYTENSVCNRWRYHLYDLEKSICLLALKKDIARGVYLISDDVSILNKGFDWGVSLIQLRDKLSSKEVIYNKAKEFLGARQNKTIPFIINDFIDIAILLEADGVHTGQDDLPISSQRKLLGDHLLIGRSTHSLEQGLAAQAEGADYVSVGPIWDTPSKPGRSAIGFDYLRQASSHLSIPYVAIGGINRETMEDIVTHSPPLVGLIRDVDAIPALKKALHY